MTNRVVAKVADAERETSNAATKRNAWVVWFVLGLAFIPTTLTPLIGHFLHRAPWIRPYVIGSAIDLLRLMLVFSVVMIGVALWRIYGKHKRPQA
jgi:polyferredoxin